MLLNLGHLRQLAYSACDSAVIPAYGIHGVSDAASRGQTRGGTRFSGCYAAVQSGRSYTLTKANISLV